MIKVKKTDSIVDIMLKLKEEKGEKIILKIPFGHSVLHNYTSLKILKIKAGEKDLIISTNDATAKKIGKKLGIKYSLSSDPNLAGQNYNFWEYFLYSIKSFFKGTVENIKSKDSPFYKYQKKYSEGKISRFVGFLIISILLLFLVYYFAVNKTYVYIKPEIEMKYRAKNFIFEENILESIYEKENVIKLKEINTNVNLKNTFGTTGIKTENITNAKGKVVLYNLFEEKTYLIEKTRLQTADGIVFLIPREIEIPAASKENEELIPGKLEIIVEARTKDAEGKITGIRGNIKNGTELFLPGLKKNKNKLYAISTSDFTGGNDNYTKILTEEDIKNASEILENKIKKLAIENLKENLKKENEINSAQYEILEAENIIIYKDFKINGLDDLKVGNEMENFDLSGSISAKTYIYNKEVLLNKLKNSIKQNLLKEVETISFIDENTLDIVLELSREENPLKIKATVQIETFYTQNFLSKENNYVNKLKDQIAGKEKNLAEKTLLNNKKISNATIKIRPFFINKVSNLRENIEFIVKE